MDREERKILQEHTAAMKELTKTLKKAMGHDLAKERAEREEAEKNMTPEEKRRAMLDRAADGLVRNPVLDSLREGSPLTNMAQYLSEQHAEQP